MRKMHCGLSLSVIDNIDDFNVLPSLYVYMSLNKITPKVVEGFGSNYLGRYPMGGEVSF